MHRFGGVPGKCAGGDELTLMSSPSSHPLGAGKGRMETAIVNALSSDLGMLVLKT